MKNQIVEKICGTLLSTVIILAVVSCSFRFIPTNKPPEPKKMVVEAPIVQTIIIVVQWIMGGGGGGQKGGSSKSPAPAPN